MKPRSFVQLLTPDLLMEFEDIIRRWGYGQSDMLVSWLAENGVKSSRSAVCRYEIALRERDGTTAQGGSIRAVVTAQGASLDTLTGLYRRLGQLEYERAKLLEMIGNMLEDQAEQGAQ